MDPGQSCPGLEEFSEVCRKLRRSWRQRLRHLLWEAPQAQEDPPAGGQRPQPTGASTRTPPCSRPRGLSNPFWEAALGCPHLLPFADKNKTAGRRQPKLSSMFLAFGCPGWYFSLSQMSSERELSLRQQKAWLWIPQRVKVLVDSLQVTGPPPLAILLYG